MLNKKYVRLNSNSIVDYKENCYRNLKTIFLNKKYYQAVLDENQNNRRNIDDKIKNINNKIDELQLKIREINNEIARIEVDVYTCYYNYEHLLKNRMYCFDDFKNDRIDINEHYKINKEIDINLENYKKRYDNLVVKLNLLKEKKNYLNGILNKYMKDKKELLGIRKEYCNGILLARNNIRICNFNIDSVNETLENIDILYFSGEDEALEKKVQPKIKKLKK